ncbi:MAG: ribosome biogenesis GTPase Der [Chloroflexi bacterium]|nr:ribosome biogenesis GTPase Der [Chloroflexota bacterium]
MSRAIVAIVGRPNVGKSTLFNRLVGAPLAVVHGTPGTTRDRVYGAVDWGNTSFTLVDTGGIGLQRADSLNDAVIAQVDLAIEQADLILFLTDLREGPVGTDLDVAKRLRRTNKPVLLVANKGDSPRDRIHASEFYELGLDAPIVVSAIRGTGTGDLLDAVLQRLPPESFAPVEGDEDRVSVAIVGRPNVGKSSLLNAIAGETRAVVDDLPGTTRDAIDTDLEYAGRPLRFIDTAGIRKRGHIEPGVESFSVLRAMRAIDRADIAVVMLDAQDAVTAQDAHVAGYIHEAAKGCVIALNKWDLVEPSAEAGGLYLATIRKGLHFLDYAPAVFTSAKTGLHVNRVLDAILEVADQRDRRIPTAQVNEFIHKVATTHPFTRKGKALKILYATQASTRPPTFVFFVNEPELVHFAYRRHLENQIRREFGFQGTGIRLVFRHRGE